MIKFTEEGNRSYPRLSLRPYILRRSIKGGYWVDNMETVKYHSIDVNNKYNKAKKATG